ncbi:hypothetical protein P0D88_24270 [Paraburkholderia sp. RL18-103-BIB-C]|jgi:hypothetical protein|uniref:hypothetical protein n=1 Tax=unclassified Paraburkholderia TaxID=2615204 RepID=UPI0038BCAF16
MNVDAAQSTQTLNQVGDMNSDATARRFNDECNPDDRYLRASASRLECWRFTDANRPRLFVDICRPV